MIPALTLLEDQVSLYNARRSGVGYDALTLIEAIADIGTKEMVLYLSKELEGASSYTVWNITQNITFPTNIAVQIPCGVVLNITSGITVTFNGACLNQCALWHVGPGSVVINARTAINTLSYRDFFNPFVVSGGLHGLSPTCYSSPFATSAYGGDGQFVTADNVGGAVAINYGSLGANCLADTVWVVISSFPADTIPGSNFIRQPGSNYFVDFVSTARPFTPRDSAMLMEVELLNDQIVRVDDLRTLTSSMALLERVPETLWTPIIYPGSFTYTGQSGIYLTIGSMMFIYGYIIAHKVSAPNDGTPVEIRGLPKPATYFSGISIHQYGGIEAFRGPGYLSGNIYNAGNSIYITDNVISHGAELVSAFRLTSDVNFTFSGFYIF